MTAVRDVSLQVEPGEFVAIVGRSGSGKTTLLNLAAGLTRPTAGRSLLDGVELWSLTDEEQSRLRNRKIGFVFQFPSLLPALTRAENVMLPTRFDATGQDAKATPRAGREPAGQVGWPTSWLLPRQLSAGQQQRVVIARALINEPPSVCWPTSPPATWTRRPSRRSWRCSRDPRADRGHGAAGDAFGRVGPLWDPIDPDGERWDRALVVDAALCLRDASYLGCSAALGAPCRPRLAVEPRQVTRLALTWPDRAAPTLVASNYTRGRTFSSRPDLNLLRWHHNPLPRLALHCGKLSRCFAKRAPSTVLQPAVDRRAEPAAGPPSPLSFARSRHWPTAMAPPHRRSAALSSGLRPPVPSSPATDTCLSPARPASAGAVPPTASSRGDEAWATDAP